MGAAKSKPKPSPPGQHDLFPPECRPPIDRATTSLADKEAEAEMTFMLEMMRLKTWAADDNNLQRVLQREDNSAHTYDHDFHPPSLPLDHEGFVRSFSVQEEASIRAFFDEFGLVVVRDAIGSNECERSVTEMWDLLERQCPGIDRNDPRTWEAWTSLSKLGFVGNTFVLSPQWCANRQAEAVHRAHAILFGTDRLRVNIGRASAMRPTRRVVLPQKPGVDGEEGLAEEVVDKPEWKTLAGGRWLHWDMNVFTGGRSAFSWRLHDPLANRGYDRLHTQGALALSDCRVQDGGFFCVPGTHRIVRGWANANGGAVEDRCIHSPESSGQVPLPKDDPLAALGVPVPLRAGSLLIWNSSLLHCNYPNDSERMRLVQYVQMIPDDDPAFGPLFTDINLLPPTSQFELTPLGERLYGFAPWP